MKLISSILLFVSWFSNAQNKNFVLLDRTTRTAVESASIFVLQAKDTVVILNSSSMGIFEIPQSNGSFDRIWITHLNYNSLQAVGEDLKKDTLYLDKNNYELDELKIKSKKEAKWNPLPFSMNLAHEQQIATLFIAEKNVGLHVKKIKAQVIDLFGVKNLKYLPFKLQLREVNPENNLPGKLIFESEVVSKKDSKKYFELDVTSLNITLPKNGLFVVFEVLDDKSYPITFISSRVGVVVAVPQLKSKRKNNSSFISFSLRDCFTEDCVKEWVLLKDNYFNLQLEF